MAFQFTRKITVFWDMITCNSVDRYQHLRGISNFQFCALNSIITIQATKCAQLFYFYNNVLLTTNVTVGHSNSIITLTQWCAFVGLNCNNFCGTYCFHLQGHAASVTRVHDITTHMTSCSS